MCLISFVVVYCFFLFVLYCFALFFVFCFSSISFCFSVYVRFRFYFVVCQTNAEQEKEAGLVSVDEELRDNSVPMCLSGFDEKGLFEADGKEV